MKLKLSVFFLLAIVISFTGGVLSQKPRIIKQVEKDLPFCTGNSVCQKGKISIFSKALAQEATKSGEIKPAGFCLSVPVLLYHHIQPQADAVAKGQTSLTVDSGIFAQQMAYLASNGYNTISASTLVNAILSHSSLPAKSVVITLDDGYLDNYIYAFPIFQQYHLTANLMVPTGLLGNSSGTNSYYSWDQLRQMVGSGLIFAYDHTWSHYALAAGPADKDVYEITTGQKQLQQYLGSASPIFVYPYGSGANLPWVWQILKGNGFAAAFSTFSGRFQCDSNIMELPRIRIGNGPLGAYGI